MLAENDQNGRQTMLSQIGQKIRTIRTCKGIGLNEFATSLGVSPAYLSNLETGKTDTIQLSLLEKIQEQLQVLPIEQMDNIGNEYMDRIQRAERLLKQLSAQDPDATDYLLRMVEQGCELFGRTPSNK